jgi:hypothetical protein
MVTAMRVTTMIHAPRNIAVKCFADDDWRLEHDVGYSFVAGGNVRGIVVPKGYSTDGASIPRFLWRIAGHPFMKENLAACILHDYCFTNRPYIGHNRCTFKQSADLYRAVQEYNGAGWWSITAHRIGILSPFARRVWRSHDDEFEIVAAPAV